MKKRISLIMGIVMMFSFSSGAFAGNVNNTHNDEVSMITLENGVEVTEEQFIEILENYEGEIYEIVSPSNAIDDELTINNNGISTMSMTIDDAIKLVGGTWYIPGVGKVVVTLTAIYVGGVIITKVSSAVATKVKSWLIQKAETKDSEKRVDGVLKGKTKDRTTKGDTNVYKGKGGKTAADKDFNKLNKGKSTTYSNGTKVGQLPDGTKINVRPGSSNVSGNKPTLEIQGKGKYKIKIRY